MLQCADSKGVYFSTVSDFDVITNSLLNKMLDFSFTESCAFSILVIKVQGYMGLPAYYASNISFTLGAKAHTEFIWKFAYMILV